MCSLCGALGQGPLWEDEALRAPTAAQRFHQATAAAAELSSVLYERRIVVDFRPDTGFTVRFPTGGVDAVRGLMDVWHLLDGRGIAVPDPLDPASR